jgi:hypothetical protein
MKKCWRGTMSEAKRQAGSSRLARTQVAASGLAPDRPTSGRGNCIAYRVRLIRDATRRILSEHDEARKALGPRHPLQSIGFGAAPWLTGVWLSIRVTRPRFIRTLAQDAPENIFPVAKLVCSKWSRKHAGWTTLSGHHSRRACDVRQLLTRNCCIWCRCHAVPDTLDRSATPRWHSARRLIGCIARNYGVEVSQLGCVTPCLKRNAARRDRCSSSTAFCRYLEMASDI